jgi:Ca2+-binding RTX toxin-like protein
MKRSISIGMVTLVFLVAGIAQAHPVTSDLSLWLRADIGITSDAAGRVSTWTDQSGANHHASQSTENQQPQLVSGGLNGKPLVRFNGQNAFFRVSGQVLTSQMFSIFAVVNDTRSSDDGSFREIFSNWTPTNSDTSVFFGTAQTNPVRARLSDDFGEQEGVGVLEEPATHFIFTGISGTTDASIYQGETLLASKGAPLSTRNLSEPYVIGNQGDTLFEYWQGDIAELLVYNRELSEEERQQNWAYLQEKYFLPMCNGLPITIMGTPGHDVLIGTEGDDVIVGLDGNDTIDGLGGDDVICGGPGHDVLIGGAGHDVLLGGPGNDTLIGGDGDDILFGGPGNDTLSGGPGINLLLGEEGNDTLEGEENTDVLLGGPGNDTCTAGNGGQNFTAECEVVD